MRGISRYEALALSPIHSSPNDAPKVSSFLRPDGITSIDVRLEGAGAYDFYNQRFSGLSNLSVSIPMQKTQVRLAGSYPHVAQPSGQIPATDPNVLLAKQKRRELLDNLRTQKGCI